MNINIIIDIQDQQIKECIESHLQQAFIQFKQTTYQHIQKPIIIFKEIKEEKDFIDFKNKQCPQHTCIFIIDKSDYAFLALGQYPLSFIRKQHLTEDLQRVIELIFDVYANIEQILTFKMGYSYIQIKSSQIIYIESYGHYLIIHTKSGEYKVRDQLNHVINLLNRNQFIQIHKSYIVNKLMIKETKSNEIVLLHDCVLPIGRKYKKDGK